MDRCTSVPPRILMIASNRNSLLLQFFKKFSLIIETSNKGKVTLSQNKSNFFVVFSLVFEMVYDNPSSSFNTFAQFGEVDSKEEVVKMFLSHLQNISRIVHILLRLPKIDISTTLGQLFPSLAVFLLSLLFPWRHK